MTTRPQPVYEDEAFEPVDAETMREYRLAMESLARGEKAKLAEDLIRELREVNARRFGSRDLGRGQ